MFRKFTQWFDRPPEASCNAAHHICNHPLCQDIGIYRAPKSRFHIENAINNEWYWFCLTHIRSYNANWNYYDGMTEQEITHERCSDLVWDRPSWPFASSPSGGHAASHASPHRGHQFHRTVDPFDLFPDDNDSPHAHQQFHKDKKTVNPRQEELNAMAILDITIPFTAAQLRSRYHNMVKKFHPDHHRDNPEAEQKIREINQAYNLLKKNV